MILSIYEDLFCDVGQEIHEYINTERDVDAIVFAIEKAHNEHPADFQSLVECLRTKERLRGTKKRSDCGKGNSPWFGIVWAEPCYPTHSRSCAISDTYARIRGNGLP